jgi:heparin binding hemagglutinin HbhA
MAVTFPTKFDVREARDQANKAVAEAVDPLRAPSLAFLGLGDLAVAAARDAVSRVQAGATEVQARVEDLPAELEELRGKLTAEDFRRLADSYVAAVRSVYTDLVKRGESAYSKLVAQPQIKQALDTVDQVSTEVESRVEDAVEEFRVRGEKTLAEVTKQTRSIGERAARATQSFAGQAAETVASTSQEIAKDINEAGDEIASETRSVTRKAAARTAPKKQGPKDAPKSAATQGGQKKAPAGK